MDTRQFEARKREHIQHSLDSAHQARGLSGLERIHLNHDALPELDLSQVQLNSSYFGKQLATPFYIAGMTAGHEHAVEINRTLALACQERGWAMGVGSQRRDLESESLGASQREDSTTASTKLSPKLTVDHWKKLRDETPDLVLFANIGLSQLIHAESSHVQSVVRDLGAHALAIHVNSLQEAMQPEGTPFFRGGIDALRSYCKDFPVPIVLKETGCGFSSLTLRKISEIGLSAVDVSGLGGTHWGRIEGARGERNSIQSIASGTFANWGEPTVNSVISAKSTLSENTEIWASGGVRSGLDAAKLIALGAHKVGYAKPALEAALAGASHLREWMKLQEYELKVALFCTGSASVDVLRKKEGVWRLNDI